jgi:hypothetical protein
VTPGHPKADDRIFASPTDKIEVRIADNLPLGSDMPPYEVYFSSEYGRQIVLHLTAGTGKILKIKNDNGTEAHLLRLNPPCILTFPGTYRLRALVNGKEVFTKSLTVRNHPALP